MAKLFIGIDNSSGKEYQYIFGQTNHIRKIIEILNKANGNLNLDLIEQADKEIIKNFFTKDEFKMAEKNEYKMEAIEITFHPFASKEKVVNLPRLRIIFSNKETYQRKYDDTTPLIISQKTEKLMSPLTLNYTIEIIEIKEVN